MTSRELACDLYPPTLIDEGLLPALEAAALRSPLEVRIVGDGVGRFPLDVEAAVYFCCLEALHNASKHAGRGARVLISLTARERTLHFVIKDDGVGFDCAAPREEPGLRSCAIGWVHSTGQSGSMPGSARARPSRGGWRAGHSASTGQRDFVPPGSAKRRPALCEEHQRRGHSPADL